jgi:predicted ATPase
MTLDPLSPEETGTLISRLLEIEALPAELRAQIVERSAGTPLFCEEFIHMLVDEGFVVRDGGKWRATSTINRLRVPQSIHAVLAARLDLLTGGEREALQAAAVIGQRFEASQVQSLLDGADVTPELDALRRKGLVGSGDRDGDEQHFRHLMIRDAAYGSLTKTRRAELHDRFRSVLESTTGDPQQVTEILAHHAGIAFTLSTELGLPHELMADRAGHAGTWSLAMAQRARTRHDTRALDTALSTLRPAAAATPHRDGPAIRAQIRLLEAQLMVMKAEYSAAREAASEAADLAEAAQLPALVATARLAEAWIGNWASEDPLNDFDKAVERAIEACRLAGDLPGEIEARHQHPLRHR